MGWFKQDSDEQSAQSARAAVTIIARGNKLTGEMNLVGKLHIDGFFEGVISSVDSITVGRRGEVKGVIRAEQVSISGRVDGDIQCNELTIEHSGHVCGTVRSRLMTIEKQGCFVGEREMTADSSLQSSQQLEQDNAEAPLSGDYAAIDVVEDVS
ncbi:MAG: cytoskeletal protein CcmA (bactofilin family) [Motiliproteus sp.]|jgi:cytoskeletal protein CcmA (bactofilin family)